MPQQCVALNCKQKHGKCSKDVTFHSFPRQDAGQRAEWIRNVCRVGVGGKPWQPTKHDRLCSLHFKPEMLDRTHSRTTLRKRAVPTKFSFESECFEVDTDMEVSFGTPPPPPTYSEELNQTDVETETGTEPTAGAPYAEKLSRTLWHYQQTGFLCDTELVAEDGHVSAHSAVLAAASSVFKLSMKPSDNTHVIVLPAVELYIVQIAVCFAYTGKLVMPSKCSGKDDELMVVKALQQLGLKCSNPCAANEVTVDNKCATVSNSQVLVDPKLTESAGISTYRKTEPSAESFECEGGDEKEERAHHVPRRPQRKAESYMPSLVMCDKCGQTVSSRNIRSHLNSHYRKKPQKCPKCQKMFCSKFAVHRHMRLHASSDEQPERQFICEVCSDAFLDIRAVHNHRWHHHRELIDVDRDEPPFACRRRECHGIRFFSKHQVVRHARSGHKTSLADELRADRPPVNLVCKKLPEYDCADCSQKFSKFCVLKIHAKTVHDSDKPLACQVELSGQLCGRRFASGRQLMWHWNRHTGAKPYQCRECGLFFYNPCSLQFHKRHRHGTGLPVAVKGKKKSRNAHRPLKAERDRPPTSEDLVVLFHK